MVNLEKVEELKHLAMLRQPQPEKYVKAYIRFGNSLCDSFSVNNKAIPDLPEHMTRCRV